MSYGPPTTVGCPRSLSAHRGSSLHDSACRSQKKVGFLRLTACRYTRNAKRSSLFSVALVGPLGVGCWQHARPGKEPIWHAYVPWNGSTCLPNIGISMMTLLAAAAGC